MKQMEHAKAWIKSKWNQGIALAKKNKLKTTTSLIILSMGVTGTALANHYYNSNTNTLYHVYLDEKDIGTVDNPEVINQYLDKQIVKEKEKFNNLKITIGNQLEFKEENKYKGSAENDQTLKTFSEQLQLKAVAQALIIDGKTVAYGTDANAIEAILLQEKEKYGPLPVENEKKQVMFKEKTSIEEAKASPDQVLTPDQLKELLEKGTLEKKIYKVQSGDTIERIAKQYNLKIKEILQMNPSVTQDGILKLNQEIVVTAPKQLLTVESIEEKQVEENLDYQTKYEPSDDLFRGDSQVVQEGKPGKKNVTYKIVTDNGQRMDKSVLKEEVISQPVDQVVKKGTKVKPSRGDGMFAWPTYGGTITSLFGERWGAMHKGIDIAGVSNRNIKASDTGRVTSAGWNGNYGNCVVIDHGNGYETWYGHLSSIKASSGDIVQKGDVIGVMGATGDATGVHLHFEIRKNGDIENPLKFMNR
ncbi:MAG TPA: M23 family metallopeptidase [Bacillota bacterium]|nr:M23 family metallopeptidase [Bacillota bacterium]